jgi:hypothetical protein
MMEEQDHGAAGHAITGGVAVCPRVGGTTYCTG